MDIGTGIAIGSGAFATALTIIKLVAKPPQETGLKPILSEIKDLLKEQELGRKELIIEQNAIFIKILEKTLGSHNKINDISDLFRTIPKQLDAIEKKCIEHWEQIIELKVLISPKPSTAP